MSFHRHHHSSNHFRGNNTLLPTIIIKLILVGLFLYLAYGYYLRNYINALFTMLIQLPLIYQTVEGWIYWVIILVLCFLIWKLIDWILNSSRHYLGKKTLWIIVSLLVILGVVIAYNGGMIKINIRDSYCKENIIPERILIDEGIATTNQYAQNTLDFVGTWKDGIAIGGNDDGWGLTTAFSSSCHRGGNEGENINYTYCDNLHYYKSTQKISKEGIIGEKVEKKYAISLILKPEGSWVYTDTVNLMSNKYYPAGNGYIRIAGEVSIVKDDWFNQYNIYRNYSIVSYGCRIE